MVMVFVHPTAVMQPREFLEMVVDGIPEAAVVAEVLCVVVWLLSLGGRSGGLMAMVPVFFDGFMCAKLVNLIFLRRQKTQRHKNKAIDKKQSLFLRDSFTNFCSCQTPKP